MIIDDIISCREEIQQVQAGISGCRIEVEKWLDGKSTRDILNDICSCQELFTEDLDYHVYLSARHYQYIKPNIDFLKSETRCTKFITSEKTVGAGAEGSDCALFIPAEFNVYSDIVMLSGI